MKGSNLPIRNTRRGKKPFLLDCRYIGGTREFFETEDQALEVREQKLSDLKNFGTQAISSLTTQDRIQFVQARDRLAKLGLSVPEAVEFVEKHFAKVEPVEFTLAIEKFIATKRAANKDPDYLRWMKSTLVSLQAATQKRELSKITRDDLETFLYGNGWAPRTIRGRRIDLRTFFKFAHGRGWIAHNPTEHLERVQLDEKPPGILTVPQVTALMRAAEKHQPTITTYLALALFAGIRPEELALMTPEDIHLKRGFVEVRSKVAKSRKRRIVELSENCKAWLKLGLHSTKKQRRRLYSAQRHAAKILGVTEFPWSHDCLRHSFGSYHLALHQSAEKTALQMGHHSTDMLFRHYRELVTRDEAEKFWSIKPKSISSAASERGDE